MHYSFITFHEKHGDRTFLFSTEENRYMRLPALVKASPEIPKILVKIAKQRIHEGWYENPPDLENIAELANFLTKRQDGEYEGFEIGSFEEI